MALHGPVYHIMAMNVGWVVCRLGLNGFVLVELRLYEGVGKLAWVAGCRETSFMLVIGDTCLV